MGENKSNGEDWVLLFITNYYIIANYNKNGKGSE